MSRNTIARSPVFSDNGDTGFKENQTIDENVRFCSELESQTSHSTRVKNVKKNMKIIKFGLLLGVGALTVNQASANLVVNGNFAAGDTGFTSDYEDGTGTQNSLLNDGVNSGAGYYAVGTTPSFYNPYWTYGPTSVPNDPNAQMLIVNGSPVGNTTVWQGNLSSGLIVGQYYTFSALVASL